MSRVKHVVLPTTVLIARGFPQEIADHCIGGHYEETLGVEEEEFRVVLSSPLLLPCFAYEKAKIEATYVLLGEKNIILNPLNAIFAGSFKESAEIFTKQFV